MNTKRIYDLFRKDIAKIFGVSASTYSSWEKGYDIIPLKHLNTLCNFHNVSMDYILSLTDMKISNHIIKVQELNKKAIGKRLKQFRKNNHLTVRTLANELGCSSSTITNYELGKNLILTAFVYQICKHYKISMDWLCARTKD